VSNTDFFDEDLVKPRAGNGSKPLAPSVTIEESPQPQEVGNGYLAQDRVVSDVDLARMSKHRDTLEDQAAKTLTEIERLKQRTDDLEVERRQLEDVRRKQDSYVNSKREMMQRLNQSLLAIEKEEVKASQLLELYSDTRHRFREMLSCIEDVDESQWPEDTMKDELSKAQDLVDSIRVECSKALVKLDTFAADEGAGFGPAGPVGSGATGSSLGREHGFVHWLKVGLALSIPLALTMGIAGVAVYLAAVKWIP